MGVLPCYRKGCERVMCDRYSPLYGYICWECFAEMEATRPLSIHEFMNSEKRDENEVPKLDYARIFRSRHE